MKAQTNVRLDPETRQKLNAIAERYGGSITTALAVAIDRMAREERTSGDHYSIADDRLAAVAAILHEPIVDVFAVMDADWDEGVEHQQWLDTAPVEEIASWAADAVRAQRELARDANG